ncbi:GIY-YIG nuclease family protein [Erythrobacter sp.]|uniref:GIY-YIG nuclease family protein n=1 Tax=Erythrobacter sp. TaxID=1042 RepID=UPI00311DA75D
MKTQHRKAAITAYKDRMIESGIYAIRSLASGQVWVGSAPDLSTIRNRVWFTLRQGGNPHRALQAAWNAGGDEDLAFEVLEVLDEDLSPSMRSHVLRTQLGHWLEELGAARI